MEEWRDIKGYEGLYQVSNEGRVKSLERVITRKNGIHQTIGEKIIKPRPIKGGHLRIVLCNVGDYTDKLVHVLVAEAFIPNPNNYAVVHHLDSNPANNRVENLKWMTHQQHIEEHKAKLVYQCNLNGGVVRTWNSTKECARNGYIQSGVASCCRGEITTYKGYIWKYA